MPAAPITRRVRYRHQGEIGEAELLGDDRLRPLTGPPAARLSEVTLLPPVTPTKVIGVGRNYRAHAAELHNPVPAEPLLFLMPSTAVIASGEPIVWPRGFERVDYEGELAVVIGREARRVAPEEALDYVAGYTCFNDVTVRDLQKRDGQFTRAKGFDSFAPLGPCLAQGIDPDDLRVVTRVDGEVRQDGRTADLIFRIPDLIATVSRVMTLLPGDVIATGTPAGVGPLRPGMTVEVEIEGIGTLRNPVVEEPA